MKQTLISIAVLVVAFNAFAQGDSSPSSPVQLDRPATANPFTGKPLSAEALQRELELRKTQSALIEEQIRQLNLEEEAKNIPIRKQAEAATVSTAIARERVAQAGLDRELRDAKALPARAESPVKGRVVAKQKPEAPEVVTKPVVPAKPTVAVLSVLHVAGKHSAMLEVNGDVVSVEDGQRTPFGLVRISENGVQLDAQRMVVSDSTIGRVKRLEVVDPAAAANGLRVSPSGALVRPDSAAPAVPAGVTTLPPLVLPPSMKAGTATPALPGMSMPSAAVR